MSKHAFTLCPHCPQILATTLFLLLLIFRLEPLVPALEDQGQKRLNFLAFTVYFGWTNIEINMALLFVTLLYSWFFYSSLPSRVSPWLPWSSSRVQSFSFFYLLLAEPESYWMESQKLNCSFYSTDCYGTFIHSSFVVWWKSARLSHPVCRDCDCVTCLRKLFICRVSMFSEKGSFGLSLLNKTF